MAKALIIALLIAIVVALGSGAVLLVKEQHDTSRLLRALTWRIALSWVLILVLVLSFYMGWVQPHGLFPPGALSQ